MGGRRTKVIPGTKAERTKPAVKKPAVAEAERSAKAPRVRKAKPGTGRHLAKEKIRGKSYLAAKKKIEPGKSYPLAEAIKIVKGSSATKFDASVEAHINLGLDLEKQGHKVRTAASLPHGTGKSIRVLVFASGKAAKAALEARADEVGDESTIDRISESGKIAFDAVVATPDFMPKLAKIARILGPQGLMPSPKSGTISDDPAKVITELKKGRVEVRTEAQPIVHTVIGKISFPDKNLIENLKTIIDELNRVKPGGVRGDYIKSVYLKSTMGPSVRVNPQSL